MHLQANSADPDQTAFKEQSDMYLHCLSLSSVLWNSQLVQIVAGLRSAVSSASDSRARGPGVDTFVSPFTDSRRTVVSYWRKYVHEVLVNRLGGLSLPRKSVVRLTDYICPDMTLDVYCGHKTTTQWSDCMAHQCWAPVLVSAL